MDLIYSVHGFLLHVKNFSTLWVIGWWYIDGVGDVPASQSCFLSPPILISLLVSLILSLR